MPSNGIQVAISGEITPTSLLDTFPVTNPYWGLGGLRKVADLADRNAITTERRESGMIVFMASDGHYYKLELGLTNSDWTDLGTSLGGGGGVSSAIIPKVRYVYLLQDAADITAMGAASNNVYGTFQAAYDAAVVLQTLYGGKVVIQIGNTTAAVVGNMTSSSAWNINITMSGISSNVSVVGTITLTNTTGSSAIRIDKVAVGNIALSTQGNIVMNDCIIGTITPSRKFASGLLTLQGNNNIIGSTVNSTTDTIQPSSLSFNLLYNSRIGDITIETTLSTNSPNIIITNCSNLIFGNITMRNLSTSGTYNIGTLTLTSSKNITIGSLTQTMNSNNNTGVIGGLNIDSSNQNIYFGGTIAINGYNSNTSSDVVISIFAAYNTSFLIVLLNHSGGNTLSTAVKGGRIDNIDIYNSKFYGRTAFINNVTSNYSSLGNQLCSIQSSLFTGTMSSGGLLFCIENVSMTSFNISNSTIKDPTNVYHLTITSLDISLSEFLIDTGTNSLTLTNITSSGITINYNGLWIPLAVPDIIIKNLTSTSLVLNFNSQDCYYNLINSSLDNFSANELSGTPSSINSIIEISKVVMNQGSEGMPTIVRSSFIKGTLTNSIIYLFYVYNSTLDFSVGGGSTYTLSGDLYTSNLIRKTTSTSTMSNNNSFIQSI